MEQKCASLIANENSKVYSVIKNEVKELQKVVNDYFDIRHNEYISSSKKTREPIEDPLFIEYLYNRVYSLLFILKINYSKQIQPNDNDVNELPF